MSGRRTVRFTLPILEYLKQLITDDLDQTDLDPAETGQARAALKRINTAIMAYRSPGPQRPSHKTLMPYLKVPVDIATAADWKVAYQRQQEERINHA